MDDTSIMFASLQKKKRRKNKKKKKEKKKKKKKTCICLFLKITRQKIVGHPTHSTQHPPQARGTVSPRTHSQYKIMSI